MECEYCGNTDADETCARCDKWICQECMREHEGEFVCPECYEIIYEEGIEGYELSDTGDSEEES
jgi:hypothetical protein